MQKLDEKNSGAGWWRGDWARVVVATLATAYLFHYARTPHEWHFIDNVNLFIHEAGHYVFFFFGDFLHILGGSLFQTIFPLPYIFYFYNRGDYFSSSLLVFWVGQNLINVSVYAADAIVMQLPLLGGDTSGHDWHNLLSMLNVLQYTGPISRTIYASGLLISILAAFLSLYFSQQSKKAESFVA